jgi:hypothetical protein
MLEHINEVAVVGCGLFMLALYVLWYSFFKVEEREGRESIELLSAGVALLVVSFMLESSLAYLDVLSIHPIFFGFLCAFFGVALLVPSALKRGGTLRSFFIHGAFIGVVCVASVLILAYWPW